MCLAPSMLFSSSNGDSNAICAALRALSSPIDEPIPMMALPLPSKAVLTSLKSTLKKPSLVMISAIPLAAMYNTSSALPRASVILKFENI